MAPRFALDNIRIQAAIQPDLTMQAVTRGTLTLQQPLPRSAIPFSLSPNMRVTAATIDGHPVEVFDRDSLRSNLIQSNDDRQFLLVSDPALNPAVPHEIEIHHEGAVIRDAGNQVYYVGSRGTWYPRTGAGLSDYDLTFRYPKSLTVAATGMPLDDHTDGEWRVTHLKTETPVRFAGFNLGNFQSVVREHNGYRIELYANRELERALAAKTCSFSLAGRGTVSPPPFQGECGRRPSPCTHSARSRRAAGRTHSNPARHARFYDRRIRPQSDSQSRSHADSRQLWAGLSGPGLSFHARLSRSTPASIGSSRTHRNRPFILNCSRPTRSRTSGGGTW